MPYKTNGVVVQSIQAESKFHRFKLRVQLKEFTALCRDVMYYDEHGCLSVCPLAYLKNSTSQLHKIFCT